MEACECLNLGWFATKWNKFPERQKKTPGIIKILLSITVFLIWNKTKLYQKQEDYLYQRCNNFLFSYYGWNISYLLFLSGWLRIWEDASKQTEHKNSSSGIGKDGGQF